MEVPEGIFWTNLRFLAHGLCDRKENAETFCAVLKYMGSFVTVPGESPGFFDPDTNDTVAAGVTGTFEGGYRSTVFTGTLKDPPDYRTSGNIGTFNYMCVILPGVV